MNSYGNFLLELLREENLGDILFSGFREMNDMLSHIDWPQIM